MAPIINVQWEYAARLSNEVNLLKSEVNRQNNRITANQVTLVEIQQQLTNGVNAIGGAGMGWPLFKGAQYYRFALSPNVPVKVVEALPNPQLRQLRFRLLSGTQCYLSYKQANLGSDWNPLELNAGMLFQDDHDGGSEVWALASQPCIILIEIRTAEQANSVGENFVIPFKAEGILGQSQSTIVDSLYNDSDYAVSERLQHWFASSEGFRVLDIQSFHPGQNYTINIEVAESFANSIVQESDLANPSDPTYMLDGNPIRYGNKAIEVWMPNFYNNLPELGIAAIANWYNLGTTNDAGQDVPKLLSLIKQNGWIASLTKNGGSASISPDYSRRFVVIYCRHTNRLVMDSARFLWDNITKTITIIGV